MLTARPCRDAGALFAAILMLCSSIPRSVAQTQETKPPASTLTQEQRAELNALNKEASVAYNRGDLSAAEKRFQQGLERATALKDTVYTAQFLNNLGMVYWSLGENEKALDYYTRGLALQEKIGSPAGIASLLNNLGAVYSDLGRNDRALDYFTRSLVLLEKIGNPASVADSLNNLGSVSRSLGQNEKALGYFTRSLAISEKIGNPAGIAARLMNLGVLYADLGRNEKALDHFSRALTLYEKIGNQADIALALNNLSTVYDALGQNEKALDYYTRALTLNEKIGNPASIARSLNSLGRIYRDLGLYQKALDYFTRALALKEKIGNHAEIAETLMSLGNATHALGQNEKALDYYTRSLSLYEKTGTPASVAATLGNLGIFTSDLGQNDRALGYFTRALALEEKIGNQADIASLHSRIGNIYSDLGRLAEAEKQFAEAKRLMESVALQVSDPSQVGAFQETFGHFYERYAALRLMRHQPEEALEMLEAGRGQGLTRQIRLTERGDITRFFTAGEQKELNEKAQALQEAQVQQRQAEQENENPDPVQRQARIRQAEAAKEAVHRAEQEVELFKDGLFARYPQLREVAANRPAPFSRLLTLTKKHPDTLYLEWGIVGKKTTLLFALGSRDGLKPLTLSVGEKALEELTRQWRVSLEISGGRGIQADRPQQDKARQEKARTEEQALAKQAYQVLLGAAQKAGLLASGRYKRLVFVGSGPILEMPLAALCDSQGKRLIERYTLSHAFSLSSFFYQKRPAKQAGSLFCVADPMGGKDQPAPAGMKLELAGAGRSAFREGFLPLPGARTEGKAVAGLFAGSKLLVGPEAKEETVTAQLPHYRILHFATHGFIVPKAIDSGLVLAQEAPESPYTGLLTARKILDLPLSAQLAVLSACETGRGRIQSGEGLMGLAWAFRAAGCPSLVVSQWAVNDAATKEWMLAFYGALKAGKAKDMAVQAAMMAVKKAHPSPFYWARF